MKNYQNITPNANRLEGRFELTQYNHNLWAVNDEHMPLLLIYSTSSRALRRTLLAL
jgi:hypothetical protein